MIRRRVRHEKAHIPFSCSCSMASLSLPAGLERIDDNVFYGSISIGTILYGGTAEQWQAVSIGDGNTALSSVPLRTS